jgi:hypothetical protein
MAPYPAAVERYVIPVIDRVIVTITRNRTRSVCDTWSVRVLSKTGKPGNWLMRDEGFDWIAIYKLPGTQPFFPVL